MAKKNVNFKKVANVLLVALPASAVVAFIMYAKIANKNIPYYSEEDLKEAKYNYESAEQNATVVFQDVLQQADKYAKSQPEYQKLNQQIGQYCNRIDNMNLVGDYDKSVEKKHSQMMNVRDSLIEKYLAKSAELNAAHDEIKYYDNKVQTLLRNKEVKDSLLNIPMGQRFKQNWSEIRRNMKQQRSR